MFSFRADSDRVERWRAWIDASGRTAEDVAGAALDEYMASHPLDGDSKTIFEVRLRQRRAKS